MRVSTLIFTAVVITLASVSTLLLSNPGPEVHHIVCQKFGSPVAAAGIMGNIAVESGYTYNYNIHQGGGGNGYGLFQFDFLRSYYFKWLSQVGKSDSAQSQVDFVWETIYGNQQNLIGSGRAATLRAGLSQGSVTATCTSFCDHYEQPGVPHLDRRIAAANTWYKDSC